MKRMGAVESDSVKSARKAKDKLHKACERASETRERTLHGQEQNNAHAYAGQARESRDSDRFHNHMHCCAEGLALQCLSLLHTDGASKEHKHSCSRPWFYPKNSSNGSTVCECGSRVGYTVQCSTESQPLQVFVTV